MIDLRSDTVTHPTHPMREAMMKAPLGDDVYRDDPTVLELEKKAAHLLEKKAALFVPSGTQGNLISVLTHLARGEAFFAASKSHIAYYEAGGSSVLGGVVLEPIEAEKDGTLDLLKLKNAIKPLDDHYAQAKLLCLENTHHGKVLPLEYIKKALRFAKEHHLKTHLDGARIFNAAISLDVPVKEISSHFDSIMFCLSKGLGAPIGSLIVSDEEFIEKARRLRKMVGGGMRQVGLLAAAGIYALDHHIERLEEDHENALLLAKGLRSIESLAPSVEVHTNMVFVSVQEMGLKKLPAFLLDKGILVRPSETLRLMTHLDVDSEDIHKVIEAFKSFYRQ